MLPRISQRIAVRIGRGSGQVESRIARNDAVSTRISDRRCIAGRKSIGAAAGIAGGDDLFEAAHVKIRIRIGLDIFSAANAGIGHDGRPTAGFERIGGAAVATAAGTGRTVERVAAAHLVTNFMGHIVDVEGVAAGHRAPRATLGLVGRAYRSEPGEAAAAALGEYVPDVVVGRADISVQNSLVLRQDGAVDGCAGGKRIGGGVSEHPGVGEQETHRRIDFVNRIDAIDRGGRCVDRIGRAAKVGGVLAGEGDGHAVGVEKISRDGHGLGHIHFVTLAGAVDPAVEGVLRHRKIMLPGADIVVFFTQLPGVDPQDALRRASVGAEAQVAGVQMQHCRGVIDALGHIGAEVGNQGLYLFADDFCFDNSKTLESAVRHGQGDFQPIAGLGGLLGRCTAQGGSQSTVVQLGQTVGQGQGWAVGPGQTLGCSGVAQIGPHGVWRNTGHGFAGVSGGRWCRQGG